MKKLYVRTFFVLALLLAMANQLKAQSIPEVLYYKFDRTDTIVINSALYPTAVTDTAFIVGGLYQDSTGQCGHALVGVELSSTTNYVNTQWAPDLDSSSWTISFWSSNITPSSTLFYIFGDNNTASFRCFTNGVAGAGTWILRGAGLNDLLATGGAQVTPTLTTFSFDSATKMSYAYVNGVLVDSVQQLSVNISGTGPFKVGAYSSSTGLNNGGLMDEFRIYNRCLSASEIAELMYVHTEGALTDSACHQYIAPSGQIITATGIYYDTIPNNIGCDSIITMDILIKMNDTTITANGVTLTANATGVSYQWVDCNNGYQIMPGDTNQIFTATANGAYAVILTGECVDTSACYVINSVGINEMNELGASVFPNPNQGNFTILSNETPDAIIIRDILGNIIISEIPGSAATKIDMSEQAKGIYFVTIRKDDKYSHIRIIVSE